jgi:D-inositol-3-phosphate glycosyltransferase
MYRLHELRKELDLENNISFLGKRSQDSLPYYYSAADVVTMPSEYESFGMVALEAMACGTPVVASQVGGLAYLIQDGETGFHIPNQDPVALSDRLTWLVEDDDLHTCMGRKAAEYARNYSWEKITDQIIDVYREVVEE